MQKNLGKSLFDRKLYGHCFIHSSAVDFYKKITLHWVGRQIVYLNNKKILGNVN